MQRIGFTILTLLFLAGSSFAQDDFRKQAPDSGPAPNIELGESQSFQLDNGLTVILVESHKLPRLSVQLYVDTPLREENEMSGLADMTGTLLSAGTEQRSKAEIDEAIDFIGASFSTNAKGMNGSSLSRHADALLAIMSEVLLQPSFPQEEFEKVQKQFISGIAANENDPDAIAGNVRSVLNYGKDHPYGEVQTQETIRSIELDSLRSYYETYFKPNISYLVFVGDVTPERAREYAESYFGNWEQEEVPESPIQDPEQPDQRQVYFVARPSAVQSNIALTYPVELLPGTRESIMSLLLYEVMGGSFLQNRLDMNLREDKGYTYGTSFSLRSDEEIGSMTASARVRNEVTDSALYELIFELERITQEPITQEELMRARAQIMGRFARALENPQTLAQYALNTLRYDLSDDFYKTYLQQVATIDEQEILAAAKKFITPDRGNVVVVGDKSIAESLVPFDADGEITYLDPRGNEKPVEAPLAADIDPQAVVEAYLEAVGGREKLESLGDATLVMKGQIQGQTMTMSQLFKFPGRMKMEMTIEGMGTVNKTVVNGDKASISAMGQPQPLSAEDQQSMQNEAVLFEELNYFNAGYELALTGQEKVKTTMAYVLEVTDPNGGKSTRYYAVDSGLLLRSIEAAGPVTSTTDYNGYELIDGIKLPAEISISGAMPFPLTFTLDSASFNTDIPEEEFAVE